MGRTTLGAQAGRALPVCLLLLGSLAVTEADAQLVSGLAGASGSAVGPDRALYVTEGAVGRVLRVDPATGATSVFASGLPAAVLPVGGAVDLAFLDDVAYVLVTMVGPPFGTHVDGLYRVDGPTSFTVVADIGSFAAANPPDTPFDLPQGVQYAIENFRGRFLVSDGHHNRLLEVDTRGTIGVFKSFENIVPTGLEVVGDAVFVAQAGAAPHLPADGRIVAVEARSGDTALVAAGGPLMVDVERGRGLRLYGLSQGIWDGAFPGSPAQPGTGALLEVLQGGALRTVAEGLTMPTSLEILDNTAYVVTLTGEIWAFATAASPPFGVRP